MSLTWQQRARLACGAALTAVAVVSAVALAGSSSDDDAGQRLAGPIATAPTAPIASSSPTARTAPSAPASPSAPGPAASSSAAPTAVPRTSGATSRPRAASPRPAATCSQEDEGPCPDGKPGWREGEPMGGCQVMTQADVEGVRSAEVAPGLVLSLRQRPDGPAGAGSVFVDLVATSTRQYVVDSNLSAAYTGMVGGRGLPVDGIDERVEVPVGESVLLSLQVFTVGCGDTSSDPPPSVGPGSHDAIVGIGVIALPVAEPGALVTASPAPPEEVRLRLAGTIVL